jgi:ATP-binding cassette subfamily B protein
MFWGKWQGISGVETGTEALRRITWPLLSRVLSYARPYIGRSIVLLAVILSRTALGLLTPLIFRQLIDHAIPQGNFRELNLLALALLAIPAASGFMGVLENTVSAQIGSGVIFDLRAALYSHLHRMSLRFFTRNKTGELMSRMNNDVLGAQTAVSSTLVDIITNMITAGATLAVMFALDWRLTLLGLVVLPLFLFVGRRIGRSLRAVARAQMKESARMNALMQETLNISGALLVKLFGRHETEVGRFRERAAGLRAASVRQSLVAARFYALMGMAGAVGTGLVYLAGGNLAIRGFFTIGTIVAFASYLTQLYGPLRSLAGAPVAFAQSMVSFERVFEVLDLPLDIQEKESAVSLPAVRGELRFEGVSFDYTAAKSNVVLGAVARASSTDAVGGVFSGAPADGGEREPHEPGGNGREPVGQARARALEELTFTIAPGQLVALVGPSGAGKTTIGYLVPRLHDPTEGRILLDGVDLRDLASNTLSAAVGMVMQETYLFHDTIRANLLFARPNAPESAITAACEAANILSFIRGLPEGLDTLVGERGYRLSGGEKQRIAIARVILKDPRILVLDEATSHMDSASEALVREALSRVMRGRTSLVIAHRLGTVMAADTILVLDRGQIVEHGTHGELLRQGGLYTRLFETQFLDSDPPDQGP